MTTCAALKRDGGRCNAPSLVGEEWCFNHHPDRAEERKRNASKAGKRGGKGRGFRTTGEIPEIKTAILKLVGDVLEGSVERSSAAVVGNLYNTLLRAVEVERKIKETEDLEHRIATLENERNGGARRWG
jgi:hypothetical protein